MTRLITVLVISLMVSACVSEHQIYDANCGRTYECAEYGTDGVTCIAWESK